MIEFFPYAMILVIILLIFVLPFRKQKNIRISQAARPMLDKVGTITNVILLILYIPLSFVTPLLGMMGETYQYELTAVQDVLYQSIAILGIFTAVPAFGGIGMSYLLRKRGCSFGSFWIQFAGLFHVAFCIVLTILLDLSRYGKV